MFMLKPTASVALDSLDESLGDHTENAMQPKVTSTSFAILRPAVSLHSLQHGKLRGDHPADAGRAVRPGFCFLLKVVGTRAELRPKDEDAGGAGGV